MDRAEWLALTDPDAALASLSALPEAAGATPEQRLARRALEAYVAAAGLGRDPLDRAILSLERWPAGPLQATAQTLASCAMARRESQPMPEHERLPDLEPLLTLPGHEGLLRAFHRCLLIKAQLHGAMGQHDLAQASALKALEISERVGPPWRRVLSKIELAHQYVQSHQDEAAQRFLLVAEDRLRASPDAHYLWYRLLSLKSTLVPDAASPQALKADMAALAHARASGSPRLLAKALNNVADQHLRMKQASLALKAAEEAAQAATRAQRVPQLLQAQQLQGLALIRLGQVERGLAEVTSAMALSSQGRVHSGSVETLRALGEALETQGLDTQALEAYHQHREAFDQLFARRTTEAILQAQAQFDARRRERSMAALQSQGQLAQEQLARDRMQIVAWSVASVLGALLLAFSLWALRRLRADNQQLAQANHALQHGSSHDLLTGLLNRRGLNESLVDPACRDGLWPAVLCLADIDHFKRVNDQWGHRCGDEVLQTFARHWQSSLPEHARLARWGGEEFLFLLPGPLGPDLQQTLTAALTLPVAARRPGLPEGLSCSIGAVPVSPDMATRLRWEELLEIADQALYEAKREGRRQVRLWSLDAGVDASTWRTLLNQAQDAPAWQMLRRTGWCPPATESGEASPSSPSSSLSPSDATGASSTPARQALPPLGDAGAPS